MFDLDEPAVFRGLIDVSVRTPHKVEDCCERDARHEFEDVVDGYLDMAKWYIYHAASCGCGCG